MLIKYYNNEELCYSNRNRYNILNFSHFNEEEQKSILLGDGSTTSIKTSVENICNYVTIDNTRWYVVSYTYLNGRQVRLNLQRDVIGEFGITDLFGKIERGITNTILKNKRELTLNQILKRRIPLRTVDNNYGSWSVDTHEGECWGILYLKEPRSDGSNKININIPEFSIPISSLTPLNEVIPGREYFSSIKSSYIYTTSQFFVRFSKSNGGYAQGYLFDVKTMYSFINGDLEFNSNEIDYVSSRSTPYNDNFSAGFFIDIRFGFDNVSSAIPLGSISALNLCKIAINSYFRNLFDVLKKGENTAEFEFNYDKSFFDLRQLVEKYSNRVEIPEEYNNAVIKEEVNGEEKYYRYNISERLVRYPSQGNLFKNPENNSTQIIEVGNYYNKKTIGNDRLSTYQQSISYTTQSGLNVTVVASASVPTGGVVHKNPVTNWASYCYFELSMKTLVKEEVSKEDAGVLELKTIGNFVDEPYSIYLVPLFNTKMYSGNNIISVEKTKSFNLFNSVIQSLYGQSGYLVDAQIYPYCPNLNEGYISFNGIPFFTAQSTSYTRRSSVSLDVFDDVKKEYICRQLSIVAPDQSNKFSFNFYDYYSSKKDLVLNIKTALKPFSIISSAVIDRDYDSLMGIDYESDLRGCQPTANGFEVSLSTDQFQDYVRNNSNYEKIFNKNQEYLEKQHEVEQGNEITQGIFNTLSVTAMGAIAGGSMADAGIFNSFGTKTAGAITGGIAAGITAGAANAAQLIINNGLREYEQNLQKELFNLNIGQIKNLPNNISRISSFNEILLKDFYYVLEVYECSEYELSLVDLYLEKYSYSLGVYGLFYNYYSNGRFLKGNLITSSLNTNLHNIASKELKGGIYYYGN